MYHLSPLLNVLYKLIRNVGRFFIRDFSEIERLQSSVKSSQDFVVKSLNKIKFNLVDGLEKIKPGLSVVNIEKESFPTCWLISETDSIINYSRGIPEFLIVIAYKEDNVIKDSIFYNPINDEVFFFSKGSGAKKNDVKLRVSEKKKLQESLISFYYDDNKNKVSQKISNLQNEFISNNINTRVNNSLFNELCLLSEGKIDAIVMSEKNSNITDIYNFVIRESGGLVFESIDEDENLYFVSNKYIGKLIKEMIEK